MTSSDEPLSSVVTFSESLAIAGLEEQWKEGDPLALVEAVTICGRDKDPYPDWVCQVLNKAMTKLYEAVYSTESKINRNDVIVSKKSMHSEDELKWKLERARDQFLISIGLSTDRDNAGKIRKRLLRDAYLAELIAQRCKFIAAPKPKFRGVNPALDDLTKMLEPNEEQPDMRRRFPPECWDAKPDTIKRAWRKHRDNLVNFYAQNPKGPVSSLEWFLGFHATEPEED